MDDAAARGSRPEPTPPVRPEDMRAGDADRELVLERLRLACAEGRLDLEEYDERVAATLVARTYGELAAVTVDLPGGPPVTRPLGVPLPRAPVPVGRPQEDEERTGLRRAVAVWAVASLLMTVTWLILGLTTGELGYPWWIWLAAPSGVLLLAGWVGAHTSRR